MCNASACVQSPSAAFIIACLSWPPSRETSDRKIQICMRKCAGVEMSYAGVTVAVEVVCLHFSPFSLPGQLMKSSHRYHPILSALNFHPLCSFLIFLLTPLLFSLLHSAFYAADLQCVSLQAKIPSCTFLPAVVPTHESLTSVALSC